MAALIFGSSGQDGHYLSSLIRRLGIDAIGISRSVGEHIGSVADFQFVDDLIRRYRPSHVFHLAATSTTGHAALFENHEAITTGSLNILESVRRNSPDARVFLSGSGLQFRNEGLPIDEACAFEASSPYALARIHSAFAARYFRKAFGIRVFVGYLFHHDSPLRTESHVNQAIVAAAHRIAAGSKEKLSIRGPDVRKEFNFAGDVVAAIWTLVQQDAIHEAVIGCGRTYSIRDWAELCFAKLGLQLQDHLHVPSGFVPPYNELVSRPTTILQLGWRPEVGFHDLAEMMLELA